MVDETILKEISEKFPDAIIIPVPSMETTNKKPNVIPFTYATKFEKYGMTVDFGIVETRSAHHTGTSTFKRVTNRPSYNGEIKKGAKYIIVDDVFAMGGTINTLRNYIEDNGGEVVAISTLTPGYDNITRIAITDETLYNLIKLDKEGDVLNAIRKLEIADNYECITEAFGKYILNNSDKLLNEERSRRTQKNSERNLSRNPQSSENKRTKKLILNSETYGFIHNNKIYLNPEVLNSNAVVHEYTHLWDNYTQRTSQDLWNNCRLIRYLQLFYIFLFHKGTRVFI